VIVQMLATCAVAAAVAGPKKDLHFGQGWRLWAMTVPPLFVLMMVSSMLAIQHVTVGTFVVVRNLGPIVTLGIETTLHRPDDLSCDLKTTACLAAIAIGVALYESHEVRLSAVGCFYLLLNLAFACAERMVQRHLLAIATVDVSKPALMILNNGIGAVLAVALVPFFGHGQWHHLSRAVRHKASTGLYLLLSCVVGCAISYTGLWLQRLVTATSFMVIGSVNKLVVVVCGILVYADAAGPISILGAALSVGGAYAYGRLK